MAVLMAAALLALIGWQYAAWTGHKGLGQSEKTEETQSASASASDTAASKTPPTANPDEDTKPSPLAPAPNPSSQTAPSPRPKSESATEPKTVIPATPAVVPATLQPVQVLTSPAGATAMLDGERSVSCITPCSLPAPPGHHSVTVTLSGYQVERREVDVSTDPVDLPPMILTAPTGTLWLASVPAGATVYLNGKRIPQLTNTQLQLAPGKYSVVMEKDGHRSQPTTVDLHRDEQQYVKLTITQ